MNKVALITGSSRGIGRAIAIQLARDGFDIAIHFFRDEKSAKDVCDEIKNLGRTVQIFKEDLSIPLNAPKLIKNVYQVFGRIDVVVNNAGHAEICSLEEITNEHIERHFSLNVNSLILSSVEASKLMTSGSSILNIGSINGHAPSSNALIYSASKAAVNNITKSMAQSLGKKGIRVNCISPGPVETDLLRSVVPQTEDHEIIKSTPLGRIGEPKDIAGLASWLVSEECRWITGQNIVASGGLAI